MLLREGHLNVWVESLLYSTLLSNVPVIHVHFIPVLFRFLFLLYD
jgi:hypothetical protein